MIIYNLIKIKIMIDIIKDL